MPTKSTLETNNPKPKVEKPVKETEKLSDEQAKSYQNIDEGVNKQIQQILKEHDGMESNIPVNHEYWDLRNKIRS